MNSNDNTTTKSNNTQNISNKMKSASIIKYATVIKTSLKITAGIKFLFNYFPLTLKLKACPIYFLVHLFTKNQVCFMTIIISFTLHHVQTHGIIINFSLRRLFTKLAASWKHLISCYDLPGSDLLSTQAALRFI